MSNRIRRLKPTKPTIPLDAPALQRAKDRIQDAVTALQSERLQTRNKIRRLEDDIKTEREKIKKLKTIEAALRHTVIDLGLAPHTDAKVDIQKLAMELEEAESLMQHQDESDEGDEYYNPAYDDEVPF